MFTAYITSFNVVTVCTYPSGLCDCRDWEILASALDGVRIAVSSPLKMNKKSKFYRNAQSKAVVGVDRLMKALSMHIQRPYQSLYRKNSLSSHSCHYGKNYFFLNQTPSCICSMCLHCIGKVSNCSIKSCCSSLSARVWTIIA